MLQSSPTQTFRGVIRYLYLFKELEYFISSGYTVCTYGQQWLRINIVKSDIIEIIRCWFFYYLFSPLFLCQTSFLYINLPSKVRKIPEAYLEPSRASIMKRFVKIVKVTVMQIIQQQIYDSFNKISKSWKFRTHSSNF